MKVVIFLNSAQNLINFRQELILFLAQKHKVIIICPYDKELENLRLNSVFCYLDINRKSKNPIRELILFFKNSFFISTPLSVFNSLPFISSFFSFTNCNLNFN